MLRKMLRVIEGQIMEKVVKNLRATLNNQFDNAEIDMKKMSQCVLGITG